MQREKKISMLRKVLGDVKINKTSKNEVVFKCPRCKHRKPKLSVNLTSDNFHCWTCPKFSGKNLLPILRLNGNTPDAEEYSKTIVDHVENKEVSRYDVPFLPSEYISLTDENHGVYYDHAIKFLKKRGVEQDDIVKMKLGYAEEGEYKYRIIFPSFDEFGDLNFVTSRAFYENMPKYMTGNYSKDIVFNDYLIDWEQPVVITEGPFDALTAGDNAIPLQGTNLRKGSRLFKKIVMTGADVFFALDSDAFTTQLEIIKMFQSYGVSCYTVDLRGHKDVSEMGKEAFKAAKSVAKPVRDRIDILRMVCA